MKDKAFALFEERLTTPSDIQAHLPLLVLLAAQCRHVTEFGTRAGFSTAAFLQAAPPTLICYDLSFEHLPQPQYNDAAACRMVDFRLLEQDTSKLDDIEDTDLLFIDSKHECGHIAVELQHAVRVRRYIVIHDVFKCAAVGDYKTFGILPAIQVFLATNPEWSIKNYTAESNGLLVLERAKNA